MPAAESEEVATPAGLALPPDALVAAAAEGLIEQAKATGVALTGEGGLLTGLVGRVLQGALESEITDHLGYERHAVAGRRSGNSRNGHYPKTVRTEVGDVEVKIPGIATAASNRPRCRWASVGSRGWTRW
jgi:hypothetical protein